MVEDFRGSIHKLYKERTEVATRVYNHRKTNPSDETAALDRRRIELSVEVARNILQIPAIYTDAPTPSFSFTVVRPPFSTEFSFKLSPDMEKRAVVDLNTNSLYTVKSDTEKPFLEITEEGLPLWHLPVGFRIKMTEAHGGVGGIDPFSDEAKICTYLIKLRMG